MTSNQATDEWELTKLLMERGLRTNLSFYVTVNENQPCIDKANNCGCVEVKHEITVETKQIIKRISEYDGSWRYALTQ